MLNRWFNYTYLTCFNHLFNNKNYKRN